MKQWSMWTGMACVMIAVLAGGCAMSGGGPSDEEAVAAAYGAWKTALLAQDVEAMLAVISPNFSHYEFGDKDGLKGFIEEAIDMGYLEDGEISDDDAETTIEEGKATIYPIDFSGAAGDVTIELTIAKEADGWLVTGMDIEGL